MISLIIPTYNRASVLSKTLSSYVRQEYVDEIIIVDDASTDSTREVIMGLKCGTSIRYIRHSSQKGAAKARLTGIKESKNQYVAFGEDDVVFDQNYIGKLYYDMENTNADIIAGRIIYLKENETYPDALIRCNNMKTKLIDYNLFVGHFGVDLPAPIEVPFVHACFLAKKEIYSEIEYDVDYPKNGYREETDPQILALKKGKKIIFTPNAYCYHLPRSQAHTGGQRTMSEFGYAYWTIRNNTRFLMKHHLFLAKRYNLRSLPVMILHATIYNLISMFYQIAKKVRWG